MKLRLITAGFGILALASFGMAGQSEKLQNTGVKQVSSATGKRTLSPDVVVSKTIYDDGDVTSDTFYNPPAVVGSGWQDYWMLVRGDVTTATAAPFDIETLSYYLRDIWNTVNGTVAIWAESNLVTAYAYRNNPGVGIHIGWNNATLVTPLTIAAPGTGIGKFWMGVWQSFPVSAPGAECGTCRVVGIDNVGVAAPNVGFYVTGEGGNSDITAATAMGSNRVPLIRAGITTTVTVPVELLEFDVN